MFHERNRLQMDIMGVEGSGRLLVFEWGGKWRFAEPLWGPTVMISSGTCIDLGDGQKGKQMAALASRGWHAASVATVGLHCRSALPG